MDHVQPAPRYPIRAVSRLTGVPVDTLRAWERRHGVIQPERDGRGRMYSEADVRKIRLLRTLIAHGHPIGRLARLGAAELAALQGGALATAPELRLLAAEPTPEVGEGSPLKVVAAALERFDGAAAERELRRLATLLPARSFVREVGLPWLRCLGEAWSAGRLSIAQEHLASAALRDLLGSLLRVHTAPGARPSLLFATPPGERHELGVLAAALVAAAAGVGAVYLGADLPTAEVAEAVRRTGVRAVVLGTLCAGEGAVRALRDLARELPPGTELWVGGPPAADLQQAVEAVGGVFLPDFDAFEARLQRLGGAG